MLLQIAQYDNVIDLRSALAAEFCDLAGACLAVILAFRAQRCARLGELMAVVHILDRLFEAYRDQQANDNGGLVDEKIRPRVRRFERRVYVKRARGFKPPNPAHPCRFRA